MSETISSKSGERPILVLVDREGLGDCLLKFPFLRALARGFPGRPIWWLSAYQTSMAENLRPYVANTISEVRAFTGIFGASRDTERRLRELPPFSMVFDTRTRLANVWQARRVLQHDEFFCFLPAYALSSRRPPGRFARPRHVGLRILSLAQAAVGKGADWSGALPASGASRATAAKLLPSDGRYVGLAIGSREPRKNWPLTRFAALAKDLSERGLVPVLLTGPQEVEYRGEARRLMPQAIDAGEVMGPLDGAIAVASRLSAAVATNSGLGHLCGACGCPVVSLFGPMEPRRWIPFAPAFRFLKATDHGGEETSLIPEGDVLRAVEDVVAEMEGREAPDYGGELEELRQASRRLLVQS